MILRLYKRKLEGGVEKHITIRNVNYIDPIGNVAFAILNKNKGKLYFLPDSYKISCITED